MKAWLADLQTTALVIFTGCILAFLTSLFFFGATILARPIDDGNWNAWLMFVAAMLGVGYATFAKKRDTTDPKIISATADAQVRVIEATAAAVPPLTQKQAEAAARVPDGDNQTPHRVTATPPGATRAVIETLQPQTATVAAAHAFDPGA